MTFAIALVKPTDIARLTDIQWTALSRNPLIQTLYPRGTTVALTDFTSTSYTKALEYPSVHLVKATDEDTGEIVAFAKWILYRQNEEENLHGRNRSITPKNGSSNGGSRRSSGWQKEERELPSTPPDCHGVLLDRWGTIITKTRKWLSGPRGHACKSGAPCSLECYFSSFAPNIWVLDILHTSPLNQKRGAGMQLVKWGTDMADREGLQCYVETSPVGYHLCTKNGFIGVAEMKIELGKYKLGYPDYKHVVMVRPSYGDSEPPEPRPKQTLEFNEKVENPFEDEETAPPVVDENEIPYTAEAKMLDLRHSSSLSATLRDTRSLTPSSSQKSPRLLDEKPNQQRSLLHAEQAA